MVKYLVGFNNDTVETILSDFDMSLFDFDAANTISCYQIDDCVEGECPFHEHCLKGRNVISIVKVEE